MSKRIKNEIQNKALTSRHILTTDRTYFIICVKTKILTK